MYALAVLVALISFVTVFIAQILMQYVVLRRKLAALPSLKNVPFIGFSNEIAKIPVEGKISKL